MGKIRAAITGVGAYLPDYILTNDELSRMVDTSDEWIMTRIGIKPAISSKAKRSAPRTWASKRYGICSKRKT